MNEQSKPRSEAFDRDTAGPVDRLAWILCQILDDDAPMLTGKRTHRQMIRQCSCRHEQRAFLAELTREKSLDLFDHTAETVDIRRG